MFAAPAATTLVFIDATLPDLATLRAGLPHDAEVHLLPPSRDGMQIIADTLLGRSGIEALHLLCHGRPGALQVGAISLNTLSLKRYAGVLDIISSAMVEDGALLIYGCEVARGADGQRFVQALRLMTGLKVAAATHKVGAADLGGDWTLDVVPGVTDIHGLKRNTLAVPQWQGVLPDTTPPMFYSAIVNTAGTTVELTYDEILLYTQLPLAAAFHVTVNGMAQSTPTSVTGVTASNGINGTITLTLAATVLATDIVRIAYTPPTTDNGTTNAAIQDVAGNDAAGLTAQHATQLNIAINSAKTDTLISTDSNTSGAAYAKVLINTGGSLTVATDSNVNTADAIQTEWIDLGVQTGGAITATDYAIEINGSAGILTSNIINFGSISAGSGGTALKNLNGVTVLTNAGSIMGNGILSVTDDDTVNVIRGSSISGYVDAGASTLDNLSLHSSDTTLTTNAIASTTVGTLTAAPWVFDLSTVGAAGTYRNFEQVWAYDNNVTLAGSGNIAAALDISSGGILEVGDTKTGAATTATGIGQLQVTDLVLEYSGTAAGTVHFDLNSAATAGTTYDQIKVVGAVTAGGALSLSLGSGFSATVGEKFTLIDNDSTDAITGTFTSLAEGATITSGAYTFGISYKGTDGSSGNDVVLTVTAAPVNTVPTLTTVTPLTGGTEDTAKIITFSDLTAAGNEADTDGTVDAFVVKSVTSGTLTIGGSAWNVSTNNTIDATHSASWTPNQDAQGNELNAFTVVAKDNGGAESATPVQVKMNVAAANDAPTFSVGNGMLSIATPGNYDAPTDAQLQPTSGKLIVANNTQISTVGWFITRMNLDGTVDSSFGEPAFSDPGKTYVNSAQAMDIGADGKIIYAYFNLAGGAGGELIPMDQFSVGRLTADGLLDTSFNHSGTYTLPMPVTTVDYRFNGIDVKALADGSVLVARTTIVSTKDVIEVVKLTSAGVLDTTFGTSGKLHVPNGGFNQVVGAMTVNADGSILIGGHQAVTDFMVVKVTAAGALDNTFGTSGQATVSMNSGSGQEVLERVTSIGVQSDGKIVVAGYSGYADMQMALARLNVDGSLDTTFGSSGKLLIDASTISSSVTAKEWINSITILSDDSIVVSGKIDYYPAISPTTPDQFAVIKLTPNGALDTSFGANGNGIVADRVVTFPNNEPYPTNNAMATVELSDGGLMVVTRTPSLEDINQTGYSNIGLVSLHANGTLNPYFGITPTLGGAAAYTENGTPAALDTSVAIFDPELAATGNYAGAVVSLQRTGTASSDDVFSALTGSNLVIAGASGNVVLSGTTTIGTFTNTAGVLTLTFNSSATQSLVNEALSSLAYENSSNSPPASVTIDWTVKESSAGNALTGSGSTTVNITPAPDSTDDTVYFPGGTEYTFSMGDFGTYSQSSGSDGSSPSVIKIMSLPSSGLTLNGSSVNVGDEIQSYDIPNLKYSGVADSFTFQVGDNSANVSPWVTVFSGENYTLTLAPNEAPTLDATKSPAFNAALGATAPVNGVTTGSVLVSDLINSDNAGLNNLADTNGDAPGLAITGVNGGTLWYSINSGATWTELTGTVSDSSALVLYANADTRVYYQPANNATAGTLNDALTIRAWDHTGNAANGTTGVAATLNVATVLDSATDGNGPWLQEMVRSGDFAFAMDDGNYSLMVFNVADPANITLVRTVSLVDRPRDIKTDGTNIYLADDDSGGVKIYSISDLTGASASVTPVGSYLDSGGNRIYSVEVDGTTAYAGVRNVGVMQLDITNPATPTLTATNPYTFARVDDMAKIGNYLYGYANGIIQIFDTTSFTVAPVSAGLESLATPIYIDGLIQSSGKIWAWNSDGVHGFIVDATSGALTESTFINTAGAYPYGISFSGTTAYVATDAGALRFNLSATPDSTTNGVATFSTPTGVYVDATNGTSSILATANGVFVGHGADLASLDFNAVQVNNPFSTATDTVAATVAGGQSDTTAPALNSSAPTDNATAVAIGSDVVLTFSENVTAVTSKNLVIYKASDNSVVTTIDAADAQVSIAGGVVTINPTADLGYSTEYYVRVDAGAFKDAANNNYAGIADTTSLSFTTGVAPDTTAPALNSSAPTDNATAVAIGSDIVLTFSENVTAVTGKNLVIYKASDNSVVTTIDAADAQVNIAGGVVTVNPTADLSYSTAYYVKVDAGAFKDAVNNNFAGITDTTSLSFTTGVAPDTTAPALNSSAPTDNATAVAIGSDIVLTFSENVTAVTGKNLVIYKASDNSVVTTIDAADAQVNIAGGVVTVNPTADLGYSTEYYVKVEAGAFKDAANNNFAGITDTTSLSFTTGVAPDTTAPVFTNAAVVGSVLTLTYGESLAGNAPSANAFTIKINGSSIPNAISAVAFDSTNATKINLSLVTPLYFGDTMAVSYLDPTSGNDVAAIQDTSGNDAVSLTDYQVTNATSATSFVSIGSQINGRSVSLAVEGGLSVNEATNTAAPATLGKTIKMPLGQFAFNITGVGNGGTANLSMAADSDLKQLTYYKWNFLTSKWTNISTGVINDTATGKSTVKFSLTDGGAYDADRTVNGRIVDPGGLAENKLLPVVLENEALVGNVTALNTDQVNGTLSWAITGGADAARFSVDTSTGALKFLSAPNFEVPTDLGDTAGNNTYQVQVTITGSNGGSEVQPLIVTVLNVPEAGDPTVGSNVTAVEDTVLVISPPISITAPVDGSTVTASRTGTTTITNPADVVTVNNTGSGKVTTTGIQGDTTLNVTGTGPQVVDPTSMKPGDVLTINNTGSGTVNLSNVPDGVKVVLLGNGPVILNDADGATPTAENQAPAITGGMVGDGNGDGTPDALQSNVASVPFLKTSTAQSNATGAPPTFVSLVADAKDGKVDTTDTNTATLENVQQLDAPANLPKSVKMPLGLISFDARVSSPGIEESFSLYVDSSTGINAYWKQTMAGKWVNLASSQYGGQVVSEGGKTRLDFKITDGGEFDSDGKADGVIKDPGAPGFSVNTPPTLSGVITTEQPATAGVASRLISFTVADEEQGEESLSLTLTSLNGTIHGLVDTNPNTAGIQLTGTAASISAAIAGATFTPKDVGAASIGIEVSDGVSPTVAGTYKLFATDNDGVSDAQENAVGDGNGDGIADAMQVNVASVTVASIASPSSITVVANAATATLQNVHLLSAPATSPSEVKLPMGLIAFTAKHSETFSVFVDASVAVNGFWEKDANGIWNNLATKVSTEGGKTRIDFAIADGSPFDGDGAVNGVVEVSGGVGAMPLTLVGHAPELPITGYWF